MDTSLIAFLKKRVLGGVTVGITRDAVIDLLGEPDDTGGMSRKRRCPQIYLYGIVEIVFDYETRTVCTGIFVDYEKADNAPFRLCASCPIADWGWKPKTTSAGVEAYLRTHGLHGEKVDAPSPTLRVLESGVKIHFKESGFLGGLHKG